MDMAAVMEWAIAADAGIITGGVEVVAITMVGGIMVIIGDLASSSPAQAMTIWGGCPGARGSGH